MDDDTTELFSFPAVGRKKLTAAFDGGRLTSDGGVMLLAAAERRLGLCDRLAAPADVIGAVNCLVFERRGDGGRDGVDVFDIVGHNTDAGGFTDSLLREAGFDPAGCRAVLLGATKVATVARPLRSPRLCPCWRSWRCCAERMPRS